MKNSEKLVDRGMTLKEYYVGLIAAAIMSHGGPHYDIATEAETIAKMASIYANALLKEIEK